MTSRIVAILWFASAACLAIAICIADTHPESPAVRGMVLIAIVFGLAFLAARNAQ